MYDFKSTNVNAHPGSLKHHLTQVVFKRRTSGFIEAVSLSPARHLNIRTGGTNGNLSRMLFGQLRYSR